MQICSSNRALPEHFGIIYHAQEPVSTRSATKRVVEILDAKYEKADIPAIVRENCSHLSATDREKLLSMLLKFEPLFDCTLGDWNLPPVSFEIKDDMKPYHGRPYPIPQIHKAVLMKEINWLCEIGVLNLAGNVGVVSGIFFPKTTDMPTCRRHVAHTTQTMLATLHLVGSLDVVSVSCWLA